jgi:hypothetical protein
MCKLDTRRIAMSGVWAPEDGVSCKPNTYIYYCCQINLAVFIDILLSVADISAGPLPSGTVYWC